MLDLMNMAPVFLAEITVEIDDRAFGMLGGLLGVGLVVMGGARGIGQVAGSAVEAIARQPEVGGRIFTSMIIAAAMIEGTVLFAIIVCLLAVLGIDVK